MAMQLEYQIARRFFADFPFDREWLHAALTGGHGEVLMDNATSPTVVILCPDARTQVSFIFGDPTSDAIFALVNRYLDDAVEGVRRFLSLPSELWRQRLTTEFVDRFVPISRVSYTFTDARLHDILDWRTKLPKGFAMCRIGVEMASRIGEEIDPDFEELWPSPERFVSESIGYCLMLGSTIAGVAYSGLPLADEITIGVATSAEFRGRGYASLTCAPLIEYCIQHGIKSNWTTGSDNAASQSVASKLGFSQAVHHVWLYVSEN